MPMQMMLSISLISLISDFDGDVDFKGMTMPISTFFVLPYVSPTI
jgi:hypothetical protein